MFILTDERQSPPEKSCSNEVGKVIPSASLTSQQGKFINDEVLIKDLQMLNKLLGRSPKTTEYKRYSNAIHRFGSWKQALYAAGITSTEGRVRSYNITKEECAVELQKYAVKLGRFPLTREFPMYQTALKLFGSWEDTLKYTETYFVINEKK